MKVTLGKIVNSVSALSQILSFNELPVKEAFMLMKLKSEIAEHIKNYDTLRVGLCQKYGEINSENKNQYTIKKENLQQFQTEFTELTNVEVELSYLPIEAKRMEVVIGENKISIGMLESLKGLVWDDKQEEKVEVKKEAQTK